MSISIHALLAESDSQQPDGTTSTTYFYPRSPCGERRVHFDNFNLHCVISIHALLAESDDVPVMSLTEYGLFLSTLSLRRATTGLGVGVYLETISIHALLAESDTSNPARAFLISYFYPRSPCGERLGCWVVVYVYQHFYPRSPCGERPCILTISICTALFLSTLSLRRATK